MTAPDLRNIIDPPPAKIVQAAEKVRIWMDSQNRGKDWQLAGVCSREAVAVMDQHITDLEQQLDAMAERAKMAEDVANGMSVGSQSNRQGELSIVMSMRQGDAVFSAGRHVSPETLRSFASSAIDHVRMEADRTYRQLQENILNAMPNDPLDDVLPLAPRDKFYSGPLGKPWSAPDIPDSEGEHHD